MAWRIIIAGLVALLVAAAVFMAAGPWLKGGQETAKLPACPYLEQGEISSVPPEIVAAIGAYEAIRETLNRGSIEGIGVQAELIERTFESSEPGVAACAKRLSGEPDVESARRAFMRLNRLMGRHAAKLPHA